MTANSSYRSCLICGCSKAQLYLKATSKIPTLSNQIQVTEKHFGLHDDLVRCVSCNFTYVGRDSYVKRIEKLYKNMSDEIYVQEEKERRLSFINVIKTIEYLRKGKEGKVLDIGCCTGGLLVEARKKGWQVYGLDPSRWACGMAKRMHGLKIFNGTMESYKQKSGSFDVITLLDVLEHVKNPRLLLQKMRILLRDNGILCIVTPDYGSFTAKILGKRWWGIRLAHLSYFRYLDLFRLFQQEGFRVIKRSAYIRYFSLYYIFIRLFPFIEKMRSVKYIMKKITIPLYLYDTFELYLTKQ